MREAIRIALVKNVVPNTAFVPLLLFDTEIRCMFHVLSVPLLLVGEGACSGFLRYMDYCTEHSLIICVGWAEGFVSGGLAKTQVLVQIRPSGYLNRLAQL